MLSDIERITSRASGSSAGARSQQHLRLLAFGYINEHVIDLRMLIGVTRAGYAALDEAPSAA
jgi:hypothetical protein